MMFGSVLSQSVAKVRVLAKCTFGFSVMGALAVGDLDCPADARFVTEFDAIPGFWTYIVGLDRNDLIAELIQNDLDQGATCTVISFERTCLVCDGNGKPVDPNGWQRLRKILGAGDEVPAKRSRLGVKNHGLKTAFTIGDEIRLLSAGQAIVQTLYAKGRNKPPHPGASEHPMEDHQAPPDGCRVIVRYRDTDLEPTQGEAIKLDMVSMEEIDALFQSACVNTPEQFAGIVSPEITPQYEIILRHWRLGEVRFFFSCTRPRKIVRRMEIFQRRCTVGGTFSPLPEALREQAVRRLVPLKGVLKDRVADFFRRGRSYFVEASWPIDARGKPKTEAGKFRYPIGYPPNSHEARTGHSANFNAPFVSDKERHAPVRHEATYKELREACESLLIDALARYTIPRWRADGLKPVVPNPDADDGDEVVRPLLAELAKRGALPVLNWRQTAELAVKTKKDSVKALALQPADRRSSRNARRYRFVVPALTWAEDAINPLLSLLCPRSEIQLHPRTHTDIIRLLADPNTPGFAEDFVTFDENDVFDRVTTDGNQFFGAIVDPEHEFSKPFIVQVYLDLIKLALDKSQFDAKKEDALVLALLLPDVHGQATAFRDLYSSVSLPSNIPSLCLPPILDPGLVTHALFKRRKWKLQRFTMSAFLEDGTLQDADEDTRRKFWNWLCQNGRHIVPRDRPKLADLIIWPDENGSLCKISDLCNPRSWRIGTVLVGFIRRPHEQVRRSNLVSVGGKAQTSIRRVPTEGEIAHWLDTRLARFEIGSIPDVATTEELERFEADFAILLKNATIARLLKRIGVTLPALAQDGSVQPRAELVIPSQKNNLLALPSRFLLKDRIGTARIDTLSAPLSAPTTKMLLSTFGEDPNNFSALHPRLRHFLSVTEPDDDERVRLAKMPIIPVHRNWRAPSELAFRGNRGDYWGVWKTRISGEDLSQDDQRRYRAAGVMSASPNAVTSREFCEWLSDQDQPVVERHIPCVLRHILHPKGPRDWATRFTDIPFIPVKGGDGLRLISLRTALAPRKPVYLSDAGDNIGDAVIGKDRAVLLVIDHVREVTEPISEPLRMLGVRSLREALKEPESVASIGNGVPVSGDILAQFRELQSTRFQSKFLKRINKLGVESKFVRSDWKFRLGRVKEIRFADEVEVRYRFRQKLYLLKVDAGFDPSSGVFWMRRGGSIGHGNLYESMAKQLVFKPTARPIDLFALEYAVGLEIDDPSFGRSAGSGLDASDDDTSADDLGALGNDGEANGRLGESGGGHSPFIPDPTRNIPKFHPMSNEPVGPRGRSRGQPGTPGTGRGGSPRQASDFEKKQIEELKLDQYASHCQMCLCKRSPLELAPAGSYIEWEEVRRKVMEAHHPDLVSIGGARHAGNLILLCKLHHDNYGRQFTRARVTAALRDNPKGKSICFGDDSHVKGQQIKLKISGTGEVIKLFFTDHHIEYWLSQETTSD